ncbi:MAG: hypothetical protein ACRDN1_19355 [Trebonia sp.]
MNEQFQLDAFGEALQLLAAAARLDRLGADGQKAARAPADTRPVRDQRRPYPPERTGPHAPAHPGPSPAKSAYGACSGSNLVSSARHERCATRRERRRR